MNKRNSEEIPSEKNKKASTNPFIMNKSNSEEIPPEKNKKASTKPSFVFVSDGTNHSLARTTEGSVFSWGKNNCVGQLGRATNNLMRPKTPGLVNFLDNNNNKAESNTIVANRVFTSVGSDQDSGHSAILDNNGNLWMSGCDRWQQLGLGSAKGGSNGYTWQKGRLWQEKFVPSLFITELINENRNSSVNSNNVTIQDVALGGDHTLVLTSNGVYGFGKGGDGQLGLVGKPFVSAPVKSTKLSSKDVSAVCAIKNCSITLDKNGSILQKAGRCASSSLIIEGIAKCISRAKKEELISS